MNLYAYNKLVDKICWKIAKLLKNRVDIINVDGEPYLLRVHFKHVGKLPGLYLHHFYCDDKDRDLHNHPWHKAVSFILSGSYKEQYLDNKDNLIKTRIFKPGDLNFIDFDNFHRVELLQNPIWTFFISRDRVQDWGFYNPQTKIYIPNEEYCSGKCNEKNFITDLDGNIKQLSER